MASGSKEELADELRTRALMDGFVRLECASCLYSAWCTDVHQILGLIEHSLTAHHQHQSLIGIKWAEFINPAAIAERLGDAV